MPPLPSVPAVLKVELDLVVGRDTTATIRQFYRYSGGPPSAADAVTLAGAIKANADAAFVSLMADQVAINFAVVTDLASPSGGQGQAGAQVTGTRGALELPAGVACLVDYGIARRYRGGKPRNYFPFGVQGDLADASTWAAAFQTAVAAGANAFIAANIGEAAGATIITQHVSVSYYSGFTAVTNVITGRTKDVPKLRPVPIVDPVVSLTVPSKPGSQRRRYQR